MASSLRLDKISIVHWFNETEKHRCGYCKGENCSISNGMWAETLTVEDYQNLIDRGWRRSGKYCYKPIMNETCCPQYTIRCDALKFIPSKSQKKIIKKFNKYLADGILIKSEQRSEPNVEQNISYSEVFMKERPQLNLCNLSDATIESCDSVSSINSSHEMCDESSKCNEQSSSIVDDSKKKLYKKGDGADPNKPPCKKAKLLRLEKKQLKLSQNESNLDKSKITTLGKSLEEFVEDTADNSKHKLKIKIIPLNESDAVGDEVLNVEFELYKKYQMVVHNDKPEKCTLKGFIRFLISSPLKLCLVRMDKKHQTYKISAKLFEKYQLIIHNESIEECREEQFYDFLVDTPLQPKHFEDVDDLGYGSFHQQYWIDDKLIAVGVIDILPRCISSVYFFYDPDYRNLTPGTYGSLRELYFIRSLNEKIPEIKHYYMGYYIHSCTKMRYKGKLSKSDLLCPETYEWFPIEKCVGKLESNKYARLNNNVNAVDINMCNSVDVDAIKILIGYKFTTFGYYKYRNQSRDIFHNIGKLVGKACANSLLFVIN